VETTLLLNKNLFEIEFNGKALGLTPREFDLLAVLMKESQRVVGRVELLRKVWTEGKPLTRVVDTYICRLRSKLQRVGHPGISAARKRGYRLISMAVEPAVNYQTATLVAG
jgi:DNA-binding response OmpR family regulator